MRYRIDYPPNRQIITLHASEELGATEDAKKFNAGLFERVHGVEDVFIFRFKAHITIGECFVAEDIVPGLIETLQMIFPGETLERMPDIRDGQQVQTPAREVN